MSESESEPPIKITNKMIIKDCKYSASSKIKKKKNLLNLIKEAPISYKGKPPRLDFIAKGSYNKLYRINNDYVLRLFTEKVVDKEKQETMEKEGYEIQLKLSGCNNINKILVYGYVKINNTQILFSIIEDDGVDLSELIFKNSEDLRDPKYNKSIIKQILEGLMCIHKEGYVHLDIKPDNIMIKIDGSNPIVSIIDFGFSKECKELETCKSYDSLGGTPEYVYDSILTQELGLIHSETYGGK